MVRPLESSADTQPQLQPALLRLSAIIFQYFTGTAAFNDCSRLRIKLWRAGTLFAARAESLPALGAHFLQPRSKRVNLLLGNSRFLLPVLAVLFEKLVEQHRVHLLVAHAQRFSFLVPRLFFVKKATWAAAFWRIGRHFRAALWAKFGALIIAGESLTGSLSLLPAQNAIQRYRSPAASPNKRDRLVCRLPRFDDQV